MSETLTRACQARAEIVEGTEIMAAGQEHARRLWNYLRYCLVSYNRELARRRGDISARCCNDPTRRCEKCVNRGTRSSSLAGKLPKYPGGFTIQKEMQDFEEYRDLSDRCASYTVKDFDIAMRSWFSNLKHNPDARPPRYCESGRTLTFEVGRNAKPSGNFIYKLTVLGGHIAKRHVIACIHVRPNVKMSQVRLLRIKPDLSVSLICRQDAPVDTPGDRVAALDIGIVNIGALVFDNGDTILYSGRAILDANRYGQMRAARCKPSEWRAGAQANTRQSARSKRYLHKAYNIRALAIHNFTTSVIRECVARGVGTLVIGDLKGIRENKDFGKAGNQKLHAWPFLEIRKQIEYKAEEVGIKVKAVSERYTSQACSRCGAIRKENRVSRGLYHCADCGMEVNADVNGAINILHKVSSGAKALGVEAAFPGLSSLTEETSGIGEPARAVANMPVFCADFDLRNWSIVMTRQHALERALQHDG